MAPTDSLMVVSGLLSVVTNTLYSHRYVAIGNTKCVAPMLWKGVGVEWSGIEWGVGDGANR